MKTTLLSLALMAGCGTTARSSTPETFDGVGTYFDKLGETGACGVPEYALESPDYVALNVQDTPNDYSNPLPRPIFDPGKVGIYNNGLNCGRWVRVTLGENCVGGVNGGEPGHAHCSGGSLQRTPVTGATMDLLVTDSCQDVNTFCRDMSGHLDIKTGSLSKFKKDGQIVDASKGWNNPSISWYFIEAPSYKGDLQIAFSKGASKYWPSVTISNLPNGISGVESFIDGTWYKARMQGDNGQVYILRQSEPPYLIRVYDVDGKLVHGGSTYEFGFPCGEKCSVYTSVSAIVVR